MESWLLRDPSPRTTSGALSFLLSVVRYRDGDECHIQKRESKQGMGLWWQTCTQCPLSAHYNVLQFGNFSNSSLEHFSTR